MARLDAIDSLPPAAYHRQQMQSKPDRLRALLRRSSTLVLATAGVHLVPHSTPLFFVMDEAIHLYWFSSPRSLHSRNLASQPAAAIAVFDPTDRWRRIRGIQMRGLVSRVEDRELRSRIVPLYCERFGLDSRFAIPIRVSALYCFTPSWARYIDNSVRFGYKFELDLPVE